MYERWQVSERGARAPEMKMSRTKNIQARRNNTENKNKIKIRQKTIQIEYNIKSTNCDYMGNSVLIG